MNFIVRVFLIAAVSFALAQFLGGVHVTDFWTAIAFAIVLALINMFIRPLLILFTLPVTIVTLGLFLFVINALVVLLASRIVHDLVLRVNAVELHLRRIELQKVRRCRLRRIDERLIGRREVLHTCRDRLRRAQPRRLRGNTDGGRDEQRRNAKLHVQPVLSRQRQLLGADAGGNPAGPRQVPRRPGVAGRDDRARATAMDAAGRRPSRNRRDGGNNHDARISRQLGDDRIPHLVRAAKRLAAAARSHADCDLAWHASGRRRCSRTRSRRHGHRCGRQAAPRRRQALDVRGQGLAADHA